MRPRRPPSSSTVAHARGSLEPAVGGAAGRDDLRPARHRRLDTGPRLGWSGPGRCHDRSGGRVPRAGDEAPRRIAGRGRSRRRLVGGDRQQRCRAGWAGVGQLVRHGGTGPGAGARRRGRRRRSVAFSHHTGDRHLPSIPAGGHPDRQCGRHHLCQVPRLARHPHPATTEPADPGSHVVVRRGPSRDWKYGFVGSRDHETGAVHLPPARVPFSSGSVDDMEPGPWPISKARWSRPRSIGWRTRRAHRSSSPWSTSTAAAGSLELTDVDAGTVEIGDRVEMTFRRLSTGDGIHNYFWKARPVRGEPGS